MKGDAGANPPAVRPQVPITHGSRVRSWECAAGFQHGAALRGRRAPRAGTLPVMSERHADLHRLREWRVGKDRDLTIGLSLRDAAAKVEEQRRAGRGAGESWEALVPARVRERCHVVLVLRGVMTVKVKDASARFEVDRWLRSGGETELVKRAGIRKVKVVV